MPYFCAICGNGVSLQVVHTDKNSTVQYSTVPVIRCHFIVVPVQGTARPQGSSLGPVRQMLLSRQKPQRAQEPVKVQYMTYRTPLYITALYCAVQYSAVGRIGVRRAHKRSLLFMRRSESKLGLCMFSGS